MFSVDQLPDEPIVVDKHWDPVDVHNELQNFYIKLGEVISQIEGPIFRIIDLAQLGFTFSDMLVIISAEAKSKAHGSVGDPRVYAVVVAREEIAELLARANNQEHYNNLEIPIFSEYNEALAHVRQAIASN
ncbi:MAG: hypothetical protein GYB65_12960 [Chloroflexi bacterium]|nr:hypothetical protein [Chloroflexota bacterium]